MERKGPKMVNGDQNKLSQDNMVKMYDIFRKTLSDSINLHRQHAQHYLTFIAAVMAATIAGLTKYPEPHLALFLLAGPMFNILLCWLAIKMCNQFYQGFLEEITVASKLEDLMGLPELRPKNKASCFDQDESILPERWIEGRRPFKKSSDFIKCHMNKGSNRVLKLTFWVLASFNIILFFFITCEFLRK
jgi:hypothetical protein